jgi:PAS domain S-box-containing protein
LDRKIRILLLEDSLEDAELIERELRRGKVDFDSRRVDSREDFIRELDEFSPDIILADYNLPSFDGLSALSLTRERRPEISFIFVSGVMGEEFAIETLKMGATDYVLKSNLSRLVPVVERALKEADEAVIRRKAEEALQENEERFRIVVESMSDLVYELDGETGRIRYFGRRRGFPGFDRLPEDIDEFIQIVCPWERKRVADYFREMIQEEGFYSLEYCIQDQDRGIYHVINRGLSLRGIKGHPGRLIGAIIDVTDRKNAEKRREIHLADLAFLSEAAVSLLAIGDEDDIYRFIADNLWNAAGEETAILANSVDSRTGVLRIRALQGPPDAVRSIAETMGRDPVGLLLPTSNEALSQFFTARLGQVPGGIHLLSFGTIPEPAAMELEKKINFQAACSMGFVSKGELLGNIIIIFPQGSLIPIRNKPFLEAFVNMAAIALQRIKAERDLLKSHVLMHKTLSGLDEAFMLLEPRERTIVDCNRTAEKMFGYSREELIGQPVDMLHVSRESLENFIREIYPDIEEKENCETECRMIRKNGEIFPAERFISLIYDESGNIEQFLSVTRDITRRKEAEKVLARSQKELEELVSRRTRELEGTVNLLKKEVSLRRKAEKELLSYQRKLKGFARDLLVTEGRERHRMALDLNDDIGQILAGTKMRIDELRGNFAGSPVEKPLGEISANFENMIHLMRNLTFDLSPPHLYELGFVNLIEWTVEEYQSKRGLHIRFEDDGKTKVLDEETGYLLYRSLLELLECAAVKSKDLHAVITCRRSGEQMEVGFNYEAAGKARGGHREKDMMPEDSVVFSVREKLACIGGDLKTGKGAGGAGFTLSAPLCSEVQQGRRRKRRVGAENEKKNTTGG